MPVFYDIMAYWKILQKGRGVKRQKLSIEVLKDIANEEKVHAGEFMKLLYELAPDEQTFYAEGAAEVADIMKTLNIK